MAVPFTKDSACKIKLLPLRYGTRFPSSQALKNFLRRKPEMTPSAARPFSARLHRLRWVLYVALALVGGLLTFVGAHAQQRATEEATFRKLLDSYCLAWSSANPDNAAKFYAQEDGLVFYDLAPFSYHSWKEYHDGVQKQFFDNASAVKLT